MGVDFLFKGGGGVEGDNGKYKIEEEGNEEGALEESFFYKRVGYGYFCFLVFSPISVKPAKVIAKDSQ